MEATKPKKKRKPKQASTDRKEPQSRGASVLQGSAKNTKEFDSGTLANAECKITETVIGPSVGCVVECKAEEERTAVEHGDLDPGPPTNLQRNKDGEAAIKDLSPVEPTQFHPLSPAPEPSSDACQISDKHAPGEASVSVAASRDQVTDERLTESNGTKGCGVVLGNETIENETVSQLTSLTCDVSSVEPSAPAQVDLPETVPLFCPSSHDTRQEERMLYPRLDSILQEHEVIDELCPFTEEDIAILYPNRQLDTNDVLVENFLKHAQQDNHTLHELLNVYLKTKLALNGSQGQLASLQKEYSVHQSLMWKTEMKEMMSTGKCLDGSKVSHSYSYKYSVYLPQHAIKVMSALKSIREVINEELCIRSYSSQLARIHIDNYLYEVLNSYPELASLHGDAPVTCWVPRCPPGHLDPHNSVLRDCISALFIFERKPAVDKEFSEDCRQWLDILLSALLRIATLPDHQFILNHLLRCPPGVGKWATKYVYLISPVYTKQLLGSQYPHGVVSSNPYSSFAYDWGVVSGLHGNWRGPYVDHFVTMLATLLFPVKGRDAFLSSLELHPPVPSSGASGDTLSRMVSQPWTFIEDSDEEDTEETHLLLKESDFISFLDQFPFTDLFQHLLSGTMGEGDYDVTRVTSYGVLQLFAFGTCLIRLLGAAFSTLKLARYKEFVKQIGRTIRQSVQYVADVWVLYKSHRLQCGDSSHTLPHSDEDNGTSHSLNRLQLEFDQFVLRATQWILTAHKLGAWQFLADMPYGSISLRAVWNVFWNIYCKQSLLPSQEGVGGGETTRSREARQRSPSSVEEIQEAVKDGHYKNQFVDHLMKTYTSEAVFLLTTFVNIARARPVGHPDEETFITTIALEIFECTQVTDYAKEAYSRTGCTLLDSIAIVHPHIISALLTRVETAVKVVGENCILLFKELPLHLWIPTSHDFRVIISWLVDSPLNSPENMLSQVITTGLNWGTKSEEGSNDLVLQWSTHCQVALAIVKAYSCHLPTQPGGRQHTPGAGLGKYASLHRLTTSNEQVEFVKWTWEIILMLKLHPNQVITQSMRTLTPTPSGTPETDISSSIGEGVVSNPSWIRIDPHNDRVILPDLSSTTEDGLAELRDSVGAHGLLAYYVAMSVTSLASDTDHFLSKSLPMVQQLLAEGYYLPVLRILANITPLFFSDSQVLVRDESFMQVVVAICNADISNSSLRERWTYTTPSHLVTKKMAALIQTQLQGACGPTGIGGEKVLHFWMDILLACPNWHRDRSVLHMLDSLCVAAHSQVAWQQAIQKVLLKAYKDLNPIQPYKGLVSTVTSSFASLVARQDGSGMPSIFNTIADSECSWLAYNALCAEQTFEEDQGIWTSLLKQLKRDSKVTIDTALKHAFSYLGMSGSFPSTHLCIYRWAEFARSVDNSHPLLALIWQRFFMLYLQRPLLDSSMPDRESQGIRFFATSRTISMRRNMRSSLSDICKKIQTAISNMDTEEGERRDALQTFLPKSLSLFQTFRLWLEEPRLHTGTLHLPSLPHQYDPNRLAAVFLADKSMPWMDFVPLWEVKGQLNSLVEEWVEIAIYQKVLKSKVQSVKSCPDSALTSLQERLKKRTNQVPSPILVNLTPPFTPLTTDVLLTRDALLAVTRVDIQDMCDKARSYCAMLAEISTLDNRYVEGAPYLYKNVPRQFHVTVPCHSRFNRSRQCLGPATIVFRIDEMNIEPRWEQELNVNRTQYNGLLNSLSLPVSSQLCLSVMKLEHTVAELAKLAQHSSESYPNVPLQCGIALFYEVLGFINTETRLYPPSCQVLTSCVQILGQEFIQRDPQQTSNILEQLLTQQSRADLLAPLFKPNLCPDQFLNMYSATAEVAVKGGPSIAFSVLTKFNIILWLENFDPSVSDRYQLLQYICQGLCLSGSKPSQESEILVEVYRRHFNALLEYKFPDLFGNTLHLIMNYTDNGSIAADVWSDLCTVIESNDQNGGYQLGLKLTQDSINILTDNYLEKKVSSGSTLYSILLTSYVPLIGKFIRQLCLTLVHGWVEAITMETTDHNKAMLNCWEALVNVFRPWIETLCPNSVPGLNTILPSCLDGEVGPMRDMMTIFVEAVTLAHHLLKDPAGSDSIMDHLWHYYCSRLSLRNTPSPIMGVYHSTLGVLPWSTFLPDLAVMDLMLKLKLMDQYPPSCFVFLGSVFPLFDWKRIAADYDEAGSHGDHSTSANFYIMFLQLLVMLLADDVIMKKTATKIPELVSEACAFHWESLNAKTYKDILNWQRNHCEPTTILHSGSCLFLSLSLLKSAAGFPNFSGPAPYHHTDTWEKRLPYIHLVVDLIGKSTLEPETLVQNYSHALAHLFQIAVDICVHEYPDSNDPQVVCVMQAILNVFSCCQSTPQVQDFLKDTVFDIVYQMDNSHLLTLPCITAGCRSIQSVSCMVKVTEHFIQRHFNTLPKPQATPSLVLPKGRVDMYGWRNIVSALVIPDDLVEEVCQSAVAESAGLLLHGHLLQHLPLCTSIAQEGRCCTKIIAWCTQLKPRPTHIEEAKLFLLWEKALGLLLRQITFVGNFPDHCSLLSSLAASMVRFGEDKASEGLLGAIGFGKKSRYSFEFRTIARVMAAHIYCQMPMDSSQVTQLRVVPNAPGHIRDTARPTPASVSSPIYIAATKLGETAITNVEHLMTNKNYSLLREHVIFSLDFIKDASHGVMDSNTLLVKLCSVLYVDCRYLDLLRVLEA